MIITILNLPLLIQIRNRLHRIHPIRIQSRDEFCLKNLISELTGSFHHTSHQSFRIQYIRLVYKYIFLPFAFFTMQPCVLRRYFANIFPDYFRYVLNTITAISPLIHRFRRYTMMSRLWYYVISRPWPTLRLLIISICPIRTMYVVH